MKSSMMPPKFGDYLECSGPFVFADFVDPDGDDARIAVEPRVLHPVGRWVTIALPNSWLTVHGVYFWTDVSEHGVIPGTVLQYALQATDEHGLKSAWKIGGPAC